MINKYKKYIAVGFAGMLGIILFYTLVLFLVTGDINHVISQFNDYKLWIIPMIFGFGVQLSLFWYIKNGMHLKGAAANTAITTGAGSSSFAMVACCAHHLVELLPILGLSAFSLILSKYLSLFFLIGIISNLVGIALMMYIIKNKKCFELSIITKNLNMKNIIIISLLGVVLVLGGVVFFNAARDSGELNANAENSLISDTPVAVDKSLYETKTNENAEVTVEVTPKKIGVEQAKNIFSISLNTHSVDLSYDFIKIVKLFDDKGKVYNAKEWTGGSGSHHLSGDIIFDKIDDDVESLRLVLEEIAGVDREFIWSL